MNPIFPSPARAHPERDLDATLADEDRSSPHGRPPRSASPRKKPQSAAQKLDHMVKQLEEVKWTIGDFLYALFRSKDEHGEKITHEKALRTSLSKFLSGETVHKPIQIIQLWLEHPFSNPATTEKNYEPLYSFDKPYLDVKHAKAAITAMVVQLCEREVLAEVRAAVRSSSGLHGSFKGSRGRKKLGWSDIGAHTVNTVEEILKRHQPLTLRLLTSIATPRARKDAKFPGSQRKQRPPHLVAVEALSTLDFSHTAYARLLPAARSILHFACGASHVLWSYGSRSGQTQSWSTTYRLLRDLAKQDAAEMVKIGQDPLRWLIERIDNVQQFHKQRERRVGRENAMRIGVAGTVAEAEDFVPAAADLDDKLRRIAEGRRKDLTMDTLLDMVDFDHLAEVAALQWVGILVNYVPCLRHYKKDLARVYSADAAKLRVPVRKTRIHPLRPVAKNEALTTELRDTVVDFLSQVGQTEASHVRRIVLVGGDGLTFEKIVKMKYQLETQVEESEFRKLQLVIPFLETWHAEWTYLSAVCETHWGEALTKDPSKLGHSATKIDQKPPPNPKKVDYYKECFTTYKTLEARQIHCWKNYYDTDDLIKHFDGLQAEKKPLPSFDEIRAAARVLNTRYATTQAANDAREGDRQRHNWPAGSEWTAPPAQASSEVKESAGSSAPTETSDVPLKGDAVLAQSILFMRDAIISKLTAEAVARGDVGTVYEGLKWMLFSFEGSGHPKYSTYMLEMVCMLELESSPEFKETFLRNWLVNPSGEPNAFQEGDLLEEHYNRILEEFIERHSMEWDDPFLQDVVAPNVEHFSTLKKTWGTGIGLAERRTRHPEPHSRPEMKILLKTYDDLELHSFRAGRKYPTSASTKDVFAIGVESLEKGKLRKWIAETMRSRSNTAPVTAEADEEEDEVEDVAEDAGEGTEDAVTLSRGRKRLVDGELVVELGEVADDEQDGEQEMTSEVREEEEQEEDMSDDNDTFDE